MNTHHTLRGVGLRDAQHVARATTLTFPVVPPGRTQLGPATGATVQFQTVPTNFRTYLAVGCLLLRSASWAWGPVREPEVSAKKHRDLLVEDRLEGGAVKTHRILRRREPGSRHRGRKRALKGEVARVRNHTVLDTLGMTEPSQDELRVDGGARDPTGPPR